MVWCYICKLAHAILDTNIIYVMEDKTSQGLICVMEEKTMQELMHPQTLWNTQM